MTAIQIEASKVLGRRGMARISPTKAWKFLSLQIWTKFSLRSEPIYKKKLYEQIIHIQWPHHRVQTCHSQGGRILINKICFKMLVRSEEPALCSIILAEC